MKRLILSAIAVSFTLISCQNGGDQNTTPEEPTIVGSDWKSTASIYEVNIRQHTAAGTINAFTADIDRIADMGIDILWIMPVQPIGEKGRKDPKENGQSLGSYYSISDYTAINDDLGTEEDFKNMVERAHSRGMKVILDWVANHTAFDHHWVDEHRDYYSLDENGDPSVAMDNEGNLTDWTDVADLNYDNPDMRAAMTAEMMWWIDNFDIDGFRCDVAGFVPHDYWQEAVPQLREKKELFMLAEWDEPYLHEVFDMTYGWDFHHRTNEVAKGEQPATTFDDYKHEVLDSLYPADAMKMLFTTNHDENSWNGTVYERYGDGHKAFFVLCATYEQGMPLVYSGQEAGLSHRLEFFYKDTVRGENRSLEAFYSATLKMKDSNPALFNAPEGGEMIKIPTSNDADIYAFYRQKDDNVVTVFLNLSDSAQAVTYSGLPSMTYEEVYTGNVINLADEGEMELGAWGYMVFTSKLTAVE